MRSLNTLALLVGFAAAIGCSDQQSVSGVFPSSGFLGRTLRVEVSGDNTSWKEGVALDFGPGVTVGSVSVSSPTTLFAEVTITDAAQPGLRDVIVRDGSDSKTLTAAFLLESPLDMTFKGKLAQGSVLSFSARNLDFFSPFDTTCGASFFGMCLEYTGMQVITPAGMNAFVDFVDPYTVTGTLYIDLDAEAGPISLVSGPADKVDEQVVSPLGTPTEVAPRTAMPLSNSPTTAMVAEPWDSQLYEYTAGAMSLARFLVNPADQDASPTVFILPESGHFLDMITASAAPKAVSSGGGKYYAVYVDGSGLSGYNYSIKVNPLPLSAMAEAASNDTIGTAQPTTGQAVYVGPATLSSISDQDWVKLTVTAADAAKSVHVFTTGNDPMTDTVVEIYKETTLIGEGDDAGYHEDVVSDPVGGAATIYVKVSASSYFQASHNAYHAVIWVE